MSNAGRIQSTLEYDESMRELNRDEGLGIVGGEDLLSEAWEKVGYAAGQAYAYAEDFAEGFEDGYSG